jgi:hypothetical protein
VWDVLHGNGERKRDMPRVEIKRAAGTESKELTPDFCFEMAAKVLLLDGNTELAEAWRSLGETMRPPPPAYYPGYPGWTWTSGGGFNVSPPMEITYTNDVNQLPPPPPDPLPAS